MKITPVSKTGPSLSFYLKDLTYRQIVERLGFNDNVTDLDDVGKVTFSWGFEVDGQFCGIWSYKRSHIGNSWSFYGPLDVAIKLFGRDKIDL